MTSYARICIGDITTDGLFAGCTPAAPVCLWTTVEEARDLAALRSRYVGGYPADAWLLPADAWTVEIVPADLVAELRTPRDVRTEAVLHDLIPGFGIPAAV